MRVTEDEDFLKAKLDTIETWLSDNARISESTDLNSATEAEQISAVRAAPEVIEYIGDPSEAVQMAAVQEDASIAIQRIMDPSEAVQLAAVKKNAYTIKYIKNPSEVIQLAATRKDNSLIRYIKNPSEAIQLAVVRQNGWAIRYIKKPSRALWSDKQAKIRMMRVILMLTRDGEYKSVADTIRHLRRNGCTWSDLGTVEDWLRNNA